MQELKPLDLRAMRKERKLTQEKLAFLTGISVVSINKSEMTGNMKLKTYFKILNALKTYQP
jgi:transcriptional regulator with XRE-family HTH domain